VIVKGRKIYFRKGAIKVDLTMERENGEVVCAGKLAGMGVEK
jgi:3-hydroxyacyl-[acyl-carrier-protein] dehydratase